MLNKILYGVSAVAIATFISVVAVSAIDIRISGTPGEIQQILSQPSDIAGGWSAPATQPYTLETPSSTLFAATTTRFAGDVTPEANNVHDLGSGGYAWNDVFASGTIYAGTLSGGTLTLTGTALESFIVANAAGTASTTLNGSSTSTFDNGISTDALLVGGSSNIGYILLGDGTGTSTLRGGTAGSATSTLTGDTSIENLYMGTLELPTDNGQSSFINAPVSASATTGTLQGISIDIDGLAVLTVVGKADAQGLTWGNSVGIRTQTPSSTLEIMDTSSSSTSFSIGDGYSTTTMYAGGSTIFTHYPNGMCDGEDRTTTTPNLTTQLCTSF